MAKYSYDLYHLLEQYGVEREAIISRQAIDGGCAYLFHTAEMTVRVEASAPRGLLPRVEVLWRAIEQTQQQGGRADGS